MPRHKKHADNPGDSSSSGSIMDDTDREVSCLTDRAFRSLCLAEEEALSDLQQKGSPGKTLQSTLSNQVSLNHTTSRSNFLNRLSIRASEHTKWTSTFQQAPKSINQEQKGSRKTSTKPSIVEFSVPDLRKHSQRSKVSSLIKTFDNIENEYPVVATPGTPRSSLRNFQKGKGQPPCDQELSAVLNNHNEVSEFSDVCHENYWLNEKYDAQKRKLSKNQVHPSQEGFSATELSTSQHPGSSTNSPLKKNLKQQKDTGKERANKSSFLHSEHSAFKSWSDHHKTHFVPIDCVEWLAEHVLLQGCDVSHPLPSTHMSGCDELHSKSTTDPSHPPLREGEPTSQAPSTQRPAAMVKLQEKEARTEVISPSSSSSSSLISNTNAMVKHVKKLPIELPPSTSSNKTMAKSPQKEPLVESPLPLTSTKFNPLAKIQGKDKLVSCPSALPSSTTTSNREMIDSQKKELPINSPADCSTTAVIQDSPPLIPPVRRNKVNRREATVEASAFLAVPPNINPLSISSNGEKGSYLGSPSPSKLLLSNNIASQNQMFQTEAVHVPPNKRDMVKHPEKHTESSSSAFSTIISTTTIKAQDTECASSLSSIAPSRRCLNGTDQDKEMLVVVPSSRSPQARHALIPKQGHEPLAGADAVPPTMQSNKKTMPLQVVGKEMGVPSTSDDKLVVLVNTKDVLKGTSSLLPLSQINKNEDTNQVLDDPQNVASTAHLPLESNKANNNAPLLDVTLPTLRNMLDDKDHSVIAVSSPLSCATQAATCAVNLQASDQKHDPGIAFTPWRRGKVKQRIQHENSKDNVKTQDNVYLPRRPTSAAAHFAETKQECPTSDTSSSFNITRLLTPIIQRKNITEALEDDTELITPPPGDISAARDHEPRTVGDGILRENYRAKASSLLFNIKDVRKRVKSTYNTSPLLKQSDEQLKDHGKIERERVENGKIDKGKVEKRKKEIENVSKMRAQETLEKEAMLKERLARETSEKEIMEREQLEREKLEKEKLEREKLEKEKRELEILMKEKVERERKENQEREKMMKLEREKLEREKIEKREREKLERLEREKIEREKWEKLEKERIEKKKKEKQEREKIIREKFERENMEKQEREKILREKIRMEKIEKEREEKEKAEREKNERAKIEREKYEREKIEREKIEREKNEKEKNEREKIEREKNEKEKIEKEKIEREKNEREKIEREKSKREKTEREKNEREKLEREHLENKLAKLEHEKIEREKIEEAEKKKIEREKNEKEKIEKEKTEREKHERDKTEREKIKREKIEREKNEREKLEREHLENKLAKLEHEKIEREKIEEAEKKNIEREKNEKEEIEKEKIEREKNERDKTEREKIKREKIEREKNEREKLEREHLENKLAKLEHEKIEREKIEEAEKKKIEREKNEKEEIEKEKIEREKNERDKIKREKIEKEKNEREKIERENNERAQLERENLENKLTILEHEGIEREKIEEAEKKKIEREKIEEAEKKKIERENFEKEMIQKEKLEKDMMKRERLEKENLEKLKMQNAEKEKAKREKIQEIERKTLEKEQFEREKVEREHRERYEKERYEMEKLEKEQIEREKKKKDTTERDKTEKDRIEREKIKADEIERENCQRERLQKEAMKRTKNEEAVNDHDEKVKIDREVNVKSNNENERLQGRGLEKKMEKNGREQLEEENIKQKNIERIKEKRLEMDNIENAKIEQEKTAKAKRERTDNMEKDNFLKQERETNAMEKENTDKQKLKIFENEKYKMQNTEKEHIQMNKIEKEWKEMMLENEEIEHECGEAKTENAKPEITKMENENYNTLGIDLQEEQKKVCLRKENPTQELLTWRTFQTENKAEVKGHMADNYLTLSSPQTIQDNITFQNDEQSNSECTSTAKAPTKTRMMHDEQTTLAEHQQGGRNIQSDVNHQRERGDPLSYNKDNVFTLGEEQAKNYKLKNNNYEIVVEKPATSIFQHRSLSTPSATAQSITTDNQLPLGHSRESGDSGRAKTSKSLYLSVEEQAPEKQMATSKEKQNERKKHPEVMPDRSATAKDVAKEELQYYSLSTSSPESEESTDETQGERRWALKDRRRKQHEDDKVIRGLSPKSQATNGTNSGETKRCSSALFKPSLFAIKDNRCKSSLVTRAVKLPLPRSLSEDCLLSCQWDGGLHSGDMIGKERQSFRDLRDVRKVEEKAQDLSTKQKALKTKSNGHGFLSGFRRIMKQFSQPDVRPISPLKMSDRCYSLPKLHDNDADIAHLFSKNGKSNELEGRPRLRDTASFIHARSISFESCTSPEDGMFYSVPSSESEYRMETSTDYSPLNRRGGSALNAAINNEIMTSPVVSSYFEDCLHSPASAISEDLSQFVDSAEYLEDMARSNATSPMSESIACSFVASPMSENTTSSGFATAMSTSEGLSSPIATDEPLKHSSQSIGARNPVGSVVHNVMISDNSEATKEVKEKLYLLDNSDKMIAKPPTVPPKTEKALRRAKRLASKRRKNEAQQQKKTYVDGTELVLTVPSPMTVSSLPLALASSMPSLVHHQTLDFKPVDPGVMRHTAAASLTPVSPMPLTQRKLLQDPDSGQYFVVDVPVQIQLKTFYDPDSGKYIQVSVPSSNVNHMQSSSMEGLNSPYVLYPEYLPLSVTSLPPTRSSSQLSAPAALMQEQLKTEKREAWTRDLANRDFAERHPYIEPVCDSYSSSPYSMDTDSYDSRRHDIISIGDLDEFAVEGIS